MNFDDEYLSNLSQHDRVRDMTASPVTKRLDNQAVGAITHYSKQPDEAVIRRIAELDREWDVDRALMLNFGIIGGATFLSGLLKDRRWLYFLGTQLLFLSHHAIRGWCPPLPVFRRLGFRTHKEIQAEKDALKAILDARSHIAHQGDAA